ncbi:hypothetical protein JMJ56_27900 [Belnapia sp. T18]|uniref:Uncharacterized protein n=1 Tax=Belnapia arida TaxID=2804533 RepID=A0ABS1UAU9_9PROT|nr:hypothetical protein [Belnapia arida]MBL6081812.1 hypothetical protein [Belnapia arida]
MRIRRRPAPPKLAAVRQRAPAVILSNNLFRSMIEPIGDTEILSAVNLTVTYQGNLLLAVGGGGATLHVTDDTTLSVGDSINASTQSNMTLAMGGDASGVRWAAWR